MPDVQLLNRLEVLGELKENENQDEMKKRLMSLETTRNLMVWLDNSTVANHGHVLCLITCLYDPAVFYTSKEYKAITGKDVDTQKLKSQKCISSHSAAVLTKNNSCIQRHAWNTFSD